MNIKEKSIKFEHYETPEWAAKAILEKEPMGEFILDPCCGSGVLANAAFDRVHHVHCLDIHDWGYKYQHQIFDFLELKKFPFENEWSVFMNPPFSKACQFVEKSIELGAHKIVCFQRFAWWESRKRKDFWQKHPPSKVYICGDRATCWRHDIPKNKHGKRYNPETGKELNGTPTAYAWFVWKKNHTGGTILSHIYKEEK